MVFAASGYFHHLYDDEAKVSATVFNNVAVVSHEPHVTPASLPKLHRHEGRQSLQLFATYSGGSSMSHDVQMLRLLALLPS
mmetsp:Transcript_10075/g.22651  ORF Transcript_10075/g.22651 Transcript_10075/m.22651 type:complete len:81 (-) Transcript_10075:1689-1931(-)